MHASPQGSWLTNICKRQSPIFLNRPDEVFTKRCNAATLSSQGLCQSWSFLAGR